MTEATPAPAAPVPAPPGTDYPGKTLGIVGLILAIVLNLVGLIVSAIALNQSKKAGFKNSPAKAGIIIGAILLVLSIIGWVLFGALFATLFNQCAALGPGVWEVDGVTYTCS